MSRLTPEGLRRRTIRCKLCPRLVQYRESIQPKPMFRGQEYWRKPVPGFGDINGRVLIIGLAPASHGGERTGRIFTGDASSTFLVSALHETGFANQPVSESLADGRAYNDCYNTAAVKCPPPGHRPTGEEFSNCSRYLEAEIGLMKNLASVLVLGSSAFKAYAAHLNREGTRFRDAFKHGGRYPFEGGPTLYASYHPSPRNTNTGVLTRAMLIGVLEAMKSDLNSRPSKHN